MSSEAEMKVAAQGNDIDGLYRVIKQDMHVLETIDSKPFDETPLHVAASFGNLEFATEIMTLKPSLALKLDPEGFTPILLALQHDQKKMVLRLVEINKELVRVKGRDGFTPLHLASQKGDTEILQKFIKACPDSIEDVTVRNETALHIAIEHGHYEAFEVLYQCLLRNSKEDAECALLNWKDQKGNTILHVAALYDGIEVIELLKKNYNLDFNAENLEGKTALDIASNARTKSTLMDRTVIWKINTLIRFINKWSNHRFGRLRRHMTAEERNAYLVVATLIATATYQSALSPPGGLYQLDAGNNNNNTVAASSPPSINYEPTVGIGGNSIMSNDEFDLFSFFNICSFMVSTISIFILLPRTTTMWLLLYLPTFFLQCSYLIAMTIISPTNHTTMVAFTTFFAYLCGFYLCLSIYRSYHIILIRRRPICSTLSF